MCGPGKRALKAHGLPYDWCRVNHDEFLPVDGHPREAGYGKLAACADHALAED